VKPMKPSILLAALVLLLIPIPGLAQEGPQSSETPDPYKPVLDCLE
jgi:hypothetical protein